MAIESWEWFMAVRDPFASWRALYDMLTGGFSFHLLGNHSNHEDGAFAEHVTAKGDLQIKIPDYMTFEEAATLGAGIITVGQSLYECLELPLPDDPPMRPFPVLIYGGSTATGTLAIQFAKL